MREPFRRRVTWFLPGLLLAGAVSLPDMARAGEGEAERLRQAAVPLPDKDSLAPLLERAAARRAVLLGECTHGTSEFYAWRAAITLSLIEQHGFRFIAVEGDGDAWYRLHPYLAGDPDAAESAAQALRTIDRWPPWLWANEETAALVEALRKRNEGRPREEQVFIYGLDLYGASRALRMLLDGIDRIDPGGVAAFSEDYRVLRAYGDDLGTYARAIAQGEPPTHGAEQALTRLREWMAARPDMDRDTAMRLEHLALSVRDAERHYRAMAQPGIDSWNARADHFFTVFERLLDRYGEESRGVAWAHNTHIGDARATPMAAQGQRNMGQSARERLGAERVFLVGLTAARGRVIAARQWGGTWRDKRMPPPRPGSLEARLKRTGIERLLLLDLAGDPPLFGETLPHRAIGVLYRPELDYAHNYVPTDVGRRYDALLFFRDTEPLRVLAR